MIMIIILIDCQNHKLPVLNLFNELTRFSKIEARPVKLPVFSVVRRQKFRILKKMFWGFNYYGERTS